MSAGDANTAMSGKLKTAVPQALAARSEDMPLTTAQFCQWIMKYTDTQHTETQSPDFCSPSQISPPPFHLISCLTPTGVQVSQAGSPA